jgi:alkylation response protein AidB-like acyl-CoA dehydrogenase
MTVSSVEMLLIAARAVFLIFSFALAAAAFTRWRRAAQAHTAQLQANHQVVLQRLADLEARVVATNVAVSQLGARVERPQQLAAAPTAAAPGYQIAIRLAKGGASRDELISGCGLSINEAELVHRLHAPQAKSTARKPARPAPQAA